MHTTISTRGRQQLENPRRQLASSGRSNFFITEKDMAVSLPLGGHASQPASPTSDAKAHAPLRITPAWAVAVSAAPAWAAAPLGKPTPEQLRERCPCLSRRTLWQDPRLGRCRERYPRLNRRPLDKPPPGPLP